MLSRTILLFLLFFLFAAERPASPSRNLIPNGNFENSANLDPWRFPNGNVFVVDSLSQKGKSSLYLKPRRGNADLFMDSLRVKPGKYQFSFWYKAKGYTGTTDRMIVELDQGKTTPLYRQVGQDWPDTLRHSKFKSWIYFSEFVEFESAQPVKFFLHTSVENFWLDNVELERK